MPHDASTDSTPKLIGRVPRSSRARVLLLAVSCLPDRGSEPGVGWNRALEAAKEFDVWVLSSEACAPAIRRYLSTHGDIPNLTFVFVQDRPWHRALRKLPGTFYVFYNLWHRRALKAARALHALVRFDLVHHVTFCGYREPGYLGMLGVPFLWGPVGGTQNYPWRFLAEAGLRGALFEGARNAANRLQLRFNRRVRRAVYGASVFLAANSTNQRDFARVYGRAPALLLETGLPQLNPEPARIRNAREPMRILWSGELRPHKALSLLIRALAELPESLEYEVRILGSGQCERRWRSLARRLKVDSHLAWLGWLPHHEALQQYSWASVFVFTSLRDTSGNAVLEALAAGVPVICLDHQGVHDIITDDCGMRIPVTNPSDVVCRLCDAIVLLARSPHVSRRLRRGAIDRATQYLWSKQGGHMATLYRHVLANDEPAPLPRATLAQRSSRIATEAAQRAASRVGAGLLTLFGSRSRDTIGILTYHRVAPHVKGLDRPTLNVRPEHFREQLTGLLARGFTVWPLRRVIEHGQRGLMLPSRTLVITFDDGFESVYCHAYPVLRDLGIPATIFLSTAYLDTSDPFSFDAWGWHLREAVPSANYRPLSSAQCQAMVESGVIDLGAHTHTHDDFRDRPSEFQADLQSSVDILRSRFGRQDVTFAFPFGRRRQGFVTDQLVAAARTTGVLCGLTTDGALVNPMTDPFGWGRFSVYDWDTGATLAAKVGGWYGLGGICACDASSAPVASWSASEERAARFGGGVVMNATAGDRPRRLLWVPLACLWILMPATFSIAGRDGPESFGAMDWIALLKVGTRGLVLIALLGVLLLIGRHERRTAVGRSLSPLGLFVMWALASCVWSPLKAVSLGQSMSLLVLVLLTGALGCLWKGVEDTSRVLFHLSVALLLMSSALLASDFANHDMSGLNRTSGVEGAFGLYHPTAAGSTASLGIVLLVACRLIWGWRWTKVLLLPGLIIYPTLLLLAASRTALALAVVCGGVVLVALGRRLAPIGVLVCLLGLVYPLVDPGLDLAQVAVRAAGEYISRGESTEQLQTLTGRTELWSAIWASFLETPVTGHGYFVTSANGALDVWSGPANHSAHNMMLQVLVTTGLIGAALFIAGLWRPMAMAFRRLGRDDDGRRARALAVILGTWYLGWGLLSESIVGQLLPESVLFFSVLGILVGMACGDSPDGVA